MVSIPSRGFVVFYVTWEESINSYMAAPIVSIPSRGFVVFYGKMPKYTMTANQNSFNPLTGIRCFPTAGQSPDMASTGKSVSIPLTGIRCFLRRQYGSVDRRH